MTISIESAVPRLIADHAADIPPVLCPKLDADIHSRQLPFVDVADFNYLAPLELYKTQKPYLSRLPFVPELKRSSIVGKGYPVRIHNVRGNEDMLTLDGSGFEYHNAPFHLDTWTDDNVQSEYIPYLKNWLQEYFECDKMFIYAYNVCCVPFLRLMVECAENVSVSWCGSKGG